MEYEISILMNNRRLRQPIPVVSISGKEQTRRFDAIRKRLAEQHAAGLDWSFEAAEKWVEENHVQKV